MPKYLLIVGAVLLLALLATRSVVKLLVPTRRSRRT
jgi:hypothetical protein